MKGRRVSRRRLLEAIQHRVARVAIGASATRGQRVPGIVARGRDYAGQVHLARFAARDAGKFSRELDRVTSDCQRALPRGARSWGLARKLMNIFIRDCLYNWYLRRAYGLGKAERFLEISLDSITATRLREEAPDLPRWPGVKWLDRATSTAYQAAGQGIAARRKIARVHLDAMWWGAAVKSCSVAEETLQPRPTG